MPDAPAIEPGLRERKRIATRRAIQLAALTVVRDRGLETATVDEIARVADVSPRTFFNYFPSKEDAIVGDGPELPHGELQESFVRDRGPVLEALADILVASVSPNLEDHEVVTARRVLLRDHPQLAARRWANIHRFEVQLIELVTRRLAEEDPVLGADGAALRSRARMVALVAIAALRHAWAAWADENSEPGSLAQRIRKSFAELSQVLAASTGR